MIDILHRKSLFFPRADKLGDPWESGTSYVNIERRRDLWSQISPDLARFVETGESGKPQRDHLLFTYISCWHENPVESAAMWKLYLKSDEGIAIQTTFTRLKDSVRFTERPVVIGRVHYFDPKADALPEGRVEQFLFKLNHYRHEMEIRPLVFGLQNRRLSPKNKG